ncbi:MAG: DUF934 domain-containing protein [Rhizobiaceae bacterium]|nr:DUF934 domain-containing protein [Rhizobiaceae bacterium]
MTEAIEPAPRLWTPQGFRDDEWQRVDELPSDAGEGSYILPLAEFLALGDNRRGELGDRLGVEIAPGEELEDMLPHLEGVGLVALAFPAFGDGRSFSKAELLRTRHGYAGPLRAVGDVLIDQLPHMIRTGFTEFAVSNPATLRRLEKGELGGISLHYQPTAKEAAKGEGYAWRRRTAG